MWITPDQSLINDNEQYTAADGTTYPAGFPKSEIPELLPVQLVPPPIAGGHQSVQANGTEQVDGQWRQAWVIVDWTPEQIRASVPRQVTMRQARLALNSAGLLGAVNAAIAAMSEPAKTIAQIEWDHAAVVERHAGLVPTMGAALGMSEAQLDDLFSIAATL